MIDNTLSGLGLTLADMQVIELAEQSAAEAIRLRRSLGLPIDDERICPQGSCLALGNPHAMTGVRQVGSAALQLRDGDGSHALVAMSNSYGQASLVVLER